MAKSQAIKFEVGQFVLFSGHRVGQVSRIAKNGAVYVNVLGETPEELRVKKADLRHVSAMMAATGDCTSEWDYVANMIRANISRKVTAQAKLADNGAYKLAPDYIPSPSCLEYCEWEGSKAAQSVMHNFGIDLVKLANLYTGKAKAEVGEVSQPIEDDAQQASVAQESIAPMGEPIQSALLLESTEESTEESQSLALAEATYALRELTFSVTRHSILTAFIDVALNKHIPGYHHQVASNLKSLMAAAFDPVHDPLGYARVNTWTMAALELVVKNKDRVAKMLSQPIEAAPIKIDRVTKLGMWLDKNMNGSDLTSAYDSCYMYDSWGKKVEACSFVVVEVIHARDAGKVEVQPQLPEYLTAQTAIAVREHYIDHWRQSKPDAHIYCGIVPVFKAGLAMQAAVEDTLASVIGSLKGIK